MGDSLRRNLRLWACDNHLPILLPGLQNIGNRSILARFTFASTFARRHLLQTARTNKTSTPNKSCTSFPSCNPVKKPSRFPSWIRGNYTPFSSGCAALSLRSPPATNLQPIPTRILEERRVIIRPVLRIQHRPLHILPARRHHHPCDSVHLRPRLRPKRQPSRIRPVLPILNHTNKLRLRLIPLCAETYPLSILLNLRKTHRRQKLHIERLHLRQTPHPPIHMIKQPPHPKILNR